MYIPISEIVSLLNLQQEADQEKIKCWQDNQLPIGAEAKNHWYPVFCGVGAVGTIMGIFLAVSHNFHILPGNAAPISGYTLLGASAIACITAYFHRAHVNKFNERVTCAQRKHNQLLLQRIEDKMKINFPKKRTLCISASDRVRMYYRLNGKGVLLNLDYPYHNFLNRKDITQIIQSSVLYKENPPLAYADIQSLVSM